MANRWKRIVRPGEEDDLGLVTRIAEMAHSGPWDVAVNMQDDGRIRTFICDKDGGRIAKIWGDRKSSPANAAYIALCSPDLILRLITEIKELRAKLAAPPESETGRTQRGESR